MLITAALVMIVKPYGQPFEILRTNASSKVSDLSGGPTSQQRRQEAVGCPSLAEGLEVRTLSSPNTVNPKCYAQIRKPQPQTRDLRSLSPFTPDQFTVLGFRLMTTLADNLNLNLFEVLPTRTPQQPFHRAVMVLDSGYLVYIRW